VAQHKRQRISHSGLAVKDVNVRAADAGCSDADENLALSGLTNIYFLDLERHIELTQDCSTHRGFLSRFMVKRNGCRGTSELIHTDASRRQRSVLRIWQEG